MTARYLVDTNVLVYAYDRSDPAKQQRALDLLDRLIQAESLACSVQSLGEFFRVVTGRIASPLSIAAAGAQIEIFTRSWIILDITAPIVLEATRGVRAHRFAYWDAQIWACARLNQIREILSEDFSDGRRVEGVRFRDPFRPVFDLGGLE